MKKPSHTAKQRYAPGSFRFGLTLATLLCWILPILIVTSTAGFLLNQNYDSSLRSSVDMEVSSALRQVEIRMLSVIEDSKAVSYDGIVRQSYRDYQLNPVKFNVYRTVSDYLTQKFTRNVIYRAAFVSFLDAELDILPYASAPGTSRLQLLQNYNDTVLPAARQTLDGQDTGIYFLVSSDRLYTVRYLLDSDFTPYAILVVELEKTELLQSVYGISQLQEPSLTIDSVPIPLGSSSTTSPNLQHSIDVDGHIIRIAGVLPGLDIWGTVPMLRWAILALLSMVFPLLLLILWLFHRNVNHPIEVLIDANTHVRSGQRGYQITETPPNSEFTLLYDHFNSMSRDLETQFRRLYEEQQDLQQAKIKALQSQINPHFLNNTLEVINWEARLAENERVCSMIEALSTMLDAAIGRNGRSQVPLSEEMKYVDAYLYITKERLGDRLTVTKQIDPELLTSPIPLLMLQPIIENAVEHDLSRRGGELCIRANRTPEGARCFEVEHDGSISAQGWENIRRSLALTGDPAADRGSVGIRNVNNRLSLLYGQNYRFTITESAPGRILAQIIFLAA